jgi:hypothetical protein
VFGAELRQGVGVEGVHLPAYLQALDKPQTTKETDQKNTSNASPASIAAVIFF